MNCHKGAVKKSLQRCSGDNDSRPYGDGQTCDPAQLCHDAKIFPPARRGRRPRRPARGNRRFCTAPGRIRIITQSCRAAEGVSPYDSTADHALHGTVQQRPALSFLTKRKNPLGDSSSQGIRFANSLNVLIIHAFRHCYYMPRQGKNKFRRDIFCAVRYACSAFRRAWRSRSAWERRR